MTLCVSFEGPAEALVLVLGVMEYDINKVGLRDSVPSPDKASSLIINEK